jgi:riboflavin kinase/FMN adenylyltransferase
MEVVNKLKKIPDLSLALGTFDGIHLGHQEVITCAVNFAKEINCKSGIITFKENPYSYFKKIPPKYILSREDKYKILESLGIDYVVELDFSRICKMTPEEYFNNIIIKYFSPKGISTGFNHYFGKDRCGNVLFLSDNQRKFDYVYFATPPQTVFGDVISSSAIRNYIHSGVMDMAASMLGRKFFVTGKVIKGKNIGTSIGFPTANVIFPSDIVEPPHGVYHSEIELQDGRRYKAILDFGIAPTVSNENNVRIEAHLLNFNENIYDQNIKIEFDKFIRPEMKFNNLEELKTRIELDIQSIL